MGLAQNASAVEPDRSADDTLRWARDVVVPGLRREVDALPERMRAIAAYHFGWSDEHGRPGTGSFGKALRPALVLLCAQAVGGDAAAAAPAAVAVELVHNFSLVHDDVMDEDPTRRHRPTVWRVFGVPQAILGGDAMLNLAFRVIAATAPARAAAAGALLADTVTRLCEGQALDLEFESRTVLEPAQYERMAAGKTGALIACSCALGALYGGGGLPRVEAFRSVGASLGLAFQVIDDLLGIWGDPSTTGKPVHADLARRKKSWPVLAGLAADGAAGAEFARLYRSRPPRADGRAQAAHLASLLEECGARQAARKRARDLLERADAQLDAVGGSEPEVAARLAALLELIVAREC
jgi:geranylgeranyl diphosphate synthase type I